MRRWILLLLLATGCAPTAEPGPPTPSPPPPPPASAPTPSPSPSPAADSLPRVREAVARAGKAFPGQAGLVYYDLAAGRGAYLGEDGVFEAASLVKLPILVELYRRAEEEGLDLAAEMTFEEKYRVGGSGVLKDREAGTRWSLRELARLMVVESDNAATDMLLDRLGPERIEAAMRRLGLQHTTVRRHVFDFAAIDRGQDNLTSPLDMFRLLKGVATGSLPGAEAMKEILLGQKRRDMIPAGLPPGTPVAHKTGELDGVLHDAGIVETPQGAYVLVLMGQGFPDREAALAAWAEASREVWKARSSGPPRT